MIQPGLERISRLLQNVQFPWKAVHVAGTNGKGSICGYTSNLLTRRLIKNGRFTSPHIVNRWDCININNEPVSEQEFRRVENYFIKLNERENINASEFELLTATAFTLFNEQKVDVGIIEVGMGGKLDATNILNNQVVSVISKIARDHQGFLGDTLEEIASHKAGILRPNVPYIVNPMNEFNVDRVIEDYAKEIGAGPRILPETEQLRDQVFKVEHWRRFAEGLLPFQRDNAVLGFLAYIEVLKSLGLSPDLHKAVKMLQKIKNTQTLPGRQQKVFVPVVFGQRREVLVDGAHNPDAATTLRDYVEAKLRKKPVSRVHDKPDAHGRYPITWVLAMTEGKEPRQSLRTLLRPGDHVITTSFGPVDGMPWVKTMSPHALLSVATEVCPGVTGLAIPKRGVYRALCAAKYLSRSAHIVLTGSLYLVGDFFREHEEGRKAFNSMEQFPGMREIDLDEKQRVEDFLSEAARLRREGNVEEKISGSPVRAVTPPIEEESEEARKLRLEIAQLEKEMQSLSKAQFGTSKSEPSTPSAKKKFFEDFENILAQVEELSPGPMTDETSERPTHKPSRVAGDTEESTEGRIFEPAGTFPRIRYHDARTHLDENPNLNRKMQSQGIKTGRAIHVSNPSAQAKTSTEETARSWESIKSRPWDKSRPRDNTKTGSGWDKLVDKSAQKKGEFSFKPGETELQSKKKPTSWKELVGIQARAFGEYRFKPSETREDEGTRANSF